ncbi:MAG: aminotransferase class V-fold PLP-dependent enzyme [Iamia sp.]
MPEPDDVRRLFSLPADLAYLNTAYMGPLPRLTVEAGWMALDRKAHPWTVVADDFFLPGETYRGMLADLLGLDADGVAITPSVSFGLSTFAAMVPMAEGQVVVVPADEFPSNLNPWSAAAARVGATVVRVPRGPEGDITAALVREVARLGDQVALVASPPCHWTDGAPIDLAAVGEAVRAVGGALAVDVCQSLGAAPFDGRAVRPDVVAGATYKWLLGPYSLGFAWFAPRWRDGPPLDHGWSNRAGAEDFAALTQPSTDFRPGARRYDVGEPAQHTQMPVALASLGLITEWGPATVATHARRLTDRIAEGAASLGFEVAPADRRSDHLLGLGLAPTGLAPDALAATLADAKVHVSVRGSSVRVSAHRFNDDDDVDRLLAALAAAVGAPSPS